MAGPSTLDGQAKDSFYVATRLHGKLNSVLDGVRGPRPSEAPQPKEVEPRTILEYMEATNVILSRCESMMDDLRSLTSENLQDIGGASATLSRY